MVQEFYLCALLLLSLLLFLLLLLLLIILHFSSFILHGCSSKIKLIIYNNIYKKQSRMFKFVNLNVLQEFCQTYFFNLSLKLQLDTISCLILLWISLNMLFASSMNVDLFMFLPFTMIIGELFLDALVVFFNLNSKVLSLFHYILVSVLMNLFIVLAVAIYDL